MSLYVVNLSPTAVRVYESLSRLTAAKSGNQRIKLVDTVIDILRVDPEAVGMQLSRLPSGTLWVTFSGFHIFFSITTKTRTVEIYSILDGPLNANRVEMAEVLCTQILLDSMASDATHAASPN